MRRLAAALVPVMTVSILGLVLVFGIGIGLGLGLAGCGDTARTQIDAAVDTAGACGCSADQICVASYDGVCGSRGATCVARTVDCPGNACSAACESTYCGAPLQCQNRAPCGGEPAGAFTCYGP